MIRFLAVIFLMVISFLSACVSESRPTLPTKPVAQAPADVRQEAVPMNAVPESLLIFYSSEKRWPKTFAELRFWLTENGRDSGFLDVCSDLKITDSAADAEATFKIREKRFSGDVEVTLPKTF